MLTAADDLRPMNMSQRDIVRRREVLRRERVQRADIDVADRIAFTGANGRQMARGDHRQGAIVTQGAGVGILSGVIIGNGLQEMLLLLCTGHPRLALHHIARA